MKTNSTVKLTVLLSLLMLGTGIVGAYFSYEAGSQALKGVNQLSTNPSKKLIDTSNTFTKPTKFKPMDEKTVLSKVYDYTNQKKELVSFQKNKFQKDNIQNIYNKTSQSLPLQVVDQEVILEIKEALNDGETMLLKINLQNRGADEIKFLYSSLEIHDDQRYSLGAIIRGLPDVLPPKSNVFSGEIRIPNFSVKGSTTLSLKLTNYPDRKLKFNINNIPVI
ncbi:hypothetical protein [Candidatus Atelocyanobacterium thalassae]|uniref:DUF4352 domain-containing protein n=1 Tax=cyanobacterium endosymbiont of Braarudosphaera bigelowii TaxID=1285375 RepID=A0ABN6K1N5_9CHRO|nr:hypothetical protein [Candidatus Atelocyanobacterium thalassa]BDA39176.1 hypothetical protein CPARK_000001500 [cyanobacterium endosymbiont of Braarudosphaera bigelowii]